MSDSEDPYDLPIFYNPVLGITTGKSRKALRDESARKRWDFFFRPSELLVRLLHLRRTTEFEQREQALSERISRRMVPFFSMIVLGGLLLGGAALAWRNENLRTEQTTNIVLAVGAGGALLLLIAFVFLSPTLLGSMRERRKLHRERRDLENRIRNFAATGAATRPPASQLRRAIEGKLDEIHQRAAQRLQLTHEPMHAKHPLPPAWGVLRCTADQLAALPEHVRAVWLDEKEGMVYAMYAVQIIFVLDDYLAVYTELYDIVADETQAMTGQVIYLADVTSIEHEVSMRNMLMGGRNLSIRGNTMRLAINNGHSASFALADHAMEASLARASADFIEEEAEKCRDESPDLARELGERARSLRQLAEKVGSGGAAADPDGMSKSIRNCLREHKRRV